jgi:hypothetical protein
MRFIGIWRQDVSCIPRDRLSLGTRAPNAESECPAEMGKRVGNRSELGLDHLRYGDTALLGVTLSAGNHMIIYA